MWTADGRPQRRYPTSVCPNASPVTSIWPGCATQSTPSPVAIGYCVPPTLLATTESLQPTVHADLRPGWTQYDLTDPPQRAQRLRLEVLAQREFAPFELSLRITVVRTAADNTCCCWRTTTSPGMMVRGGCSSPISPRRTKELTELTSGGRTKTNQDSPAAVTVGGDLLNTT